MTAPRTIELHKRYWVCFKCDRMVVDKSEATLACIHNERFATSTYTMIEVFPHEALKEEPMPAKPEEVVLHRSYMEPWEVCYINPNNPERCMEYEHRRVIVLPPVEEKKNMHVALWSDGFVVQKCFDVDPCGCYHTTPHRTLLTNTNALRLAAALNECVERHKEKA